MNAHPFDRDDINTAARVLADRFPDLNNPHTLATLVLTEVMADRHRRDHQHANRPHRRVLTALTRVRGAR